MSRKIKFRIWDKSNERWWCEDSQYLQMDGEKIHPAPWSTLSAELPDDNIIIQQYTGLLDKNGKEIYEGDIVKFKEWKPKEIFYECGENEKGFAGFRLKNTDMFLMGWDADFMEIVGNIFKNPELI